MLDSLGPYRIDRELGSGGMGKVYAAIVDGRVPGLDAGTRVALKVVHEHLLETPGFFKRFLREAEIGKTVRHPNVVRTYDCDATAGQHFLAMEYVEGQTLRDLLVELDRVPEELCRHIGREVAKGLSAIHAAGAIHRDMKPENVLITADHVVKVMDLGVARLADEALRLSQTGAFVGSLHYAAPESFQSGGAEMDGRVDLHALGLVLYELACGSNPYLADDVPKTIRKVLKDKPRKLGDVNPQLSPFFEEVVHCLLEKDKDKRFSSADELAKVLADGEDSAWWKQRSLTLRVETKRPLRRVRIPRETAVYGREKELAKLTALYEQARSGDSQVVLIEGEAGIGKSRLADELIGRLQADGEDLNFLFGSYPPGGAASAAGGFSSAYREHFGGAGSAGYLAQTPLLVPGFDAVLRGEPSPTGALKLTKDSLGTCFVHATRNLAAERMTVVLIDDLHFAPEEARDLFTALALAVPDHRVLLVGTMRPGVPEDWIANVTRLDQVMRMDLQRLGPKDLAALLKDSFQSDALARSLSMQIGEKSDGNPFFAFEIIRGLREGQFITRQDDGTWVGTKVIDDIQIPSSVLDLVNARIADLDDEDKDLLEVASCWGYEFDPVLVAVAAGSPVVPALKRFGRIEKSHRLVRAAGRSVVFDHHQVQEALYGGILEQLREHYHAALAEALEARTKAADRDPETLDGALCVDLCDHYLKGARGESALRYLPAAQAHLTSGYLHAEMAVLTERALAVPDLLVGVERAKTLLRLASALDPLGRRSRQEECAQEAERLAEEADDDELRMKAASALGSVLYHTSRQPEAEAAHRRALEIAVVRGDKRAEAAATGSLGLVFNFLDRYMEASQHFERELAVCLEIGARQGEANATGNLGIVLWSQGRLPEAQAYLERQLALSRQIGDRPGETRAAGNLGCVLQSKGRYAEAREHLERGLTLGRETGNRRSEAIATGNLGNLLHREGHDAEALEHHQRCLALCREIGNREGEACFLGDLGRTWHALGDRARARSTLGQSIALCREIGTRYFEGYGILDLGRLADEEGNPSQALQLTQASLALRREIGHGDGVADSLIELGVLLLRAGRTEPARAALEEAAEFAREQRRNAEVALALALLACLPGGDAEAALAALGELDEDGDSARLRWLLYRATGDRSHLEAAKHLLDDQLAKNPPEYHESMCTNVRVNREILAAWREEFGEEGDAPEGASPGESPTRAGDPLT